MGDCQSNYSKNLPVEEEYTVGDRYMDHGGYVSRFRGRSEQRERDVEAMSTTKRKKPEPPEYLKNKSPSKLAWAGTITDTYAVTNKDKVLSKTAKFEGNGYFTVPKGTEVDVSLGGDIYRIKLSKKIDVVGIAVEIEGTVIKTDLQEDIPF